MPTKKKQPDPEYVADTPAREALEAKLAAEDVPEESGPNPNHTPRHEPSLEEQERISKIQTRKAREVRLRQMRRLDKALDVHLKNLEEVITEQAAKISEQQATIAQLEAQLAAK
ncbi:hypothetical protein [Cerasicoccus arenae]|uniref:Uncharacterized protein n=1 Tax=Cerasicoccus arenae TaxID=424488 RepID=A0A8J3DBT9_9BACT|nr:hypothetical protein [Cerasicoccus arenae]MBK1858233.1 hypothetical protein [Cerasicoccus arenae]GHC02056.1 hypothetical protein GCM10007047_18200 [Cerasicoccus arenae]